MPMPPASVLRHRSSGIRYLSKVPKYSSTGPGPLIAVPYRTGSAPTLFFISLLDWLDAGQYCIPAFTKPVRRWNGVHPAPPYFSLLVSCFIPGPAFRYQGQSGTADHGIVRGCPPMLIAISSLSCMVAHSKLYITICDKGSSAVVQKLYMFSRSWILVFSSRPNAEFGLADEAVKGTVAAPRREWGCFCGVLGKRPQETRSGKYVLGGKGTGLRE